ncbi:GGDEF domain-containing protein [Helicovermis profundi]|uniref:GGDEF domain-containing protein n=1 Tax=Helicovermis profundi TaxID=3065157 RepID=A0AAU9ES30_9FIRM|nr:GGDEF domain-containing protein [Clostridia bacterium S502]
MSKYVKEHNQVVKFIEENNLVEAEKINKIIYNNSIKCEYDNDIIKSNINFGTIFEKKGDLNNALDKYSRALTLAKHAGKNELWIDVQRKRARIFLFSGKHRLALKIYLELLNKINEENISIHRKASILNNSAVIYRDLGKIDLALKYFEECRIASVKSNECILEAISLYNIAEIMCFKNQYKKSSELLNHSREISIRIKDELGKDMCNCLEAELYIKTDYKKSIDMFEKSNLRVKDIGNMHDYIEVVYNYAFELTKYDYTEVAVEILENLNLKNLSNEYFLKEKEAFNLLSMYYMKQSNYEKAFYYEKRKSELMEYTISQWNEMEFAYIGSDFNKVTTNNQMDELKSSLEIMDTLSKIGKVITTSIDFNDVYKILEKHLSKTMNLMTYGVGIIETEKLHYRYSHENVFKQAYIDLDDYKKLMNICIRDKKEIFIVDSKNLSEYKNKFSKDLVDLIYNSKVKSVIFCPIFFDNEIIGGLTVQSDKNFTYNYMDLEKIRFLSSYLAISITNYQKNKEILNKNKELELISKVDALTGAKNRHALSEYIESVFDKNKNLIMPLGVCMIDLDHFKQYNDNYGHVKGDKVLSKITSNIIEVIKKEKAHIFRYGGDEFLIIFEKISKNNLEEALENIRKIVFDLNIEHKYSLVSDRVTLSAGGIITENSKINQVDLFKFADEVLYKAKSKSKNTFIVEEVC